jgi:hypothetical protein
MGFGCRRLSGRPDESIRNIGGCVNKLREKASVAPATVTKISRGERVTPRRKAGKPQNVASPVKASKPDVRVWKVALRLAKGNHKRLEVVEPTTVIVHNHTNWKASK